MKRSRFRYLHKVTMSKKTRGCGNCRCRDLCQRVGQLDFLGVLTCWVETPDWSSIIDDEYAEAAAKFFDDEYERLTAEVTYGKK